MIKCQFVDGNKGNLRHVTVGGVIVQENKILLVKRSDKLTEGGKFCLPGGFLNRDEIISQGAAREVEEETGYKVLKTELFYFTDDPQRLNEKNQNVCFYFIIKVGEQVSEPDWEVTELNWFDFNSLPRVESLAFDHYQVIQLYIEYRDKKVLLFGHGNVIEKYERGART